MHERTPNRYERNENYVGSIVSRPIESKKEIKMQDFPLHVRASGFVPAAATRATAKPAMRQFFEMSKRLMQHSFSLRPDLRVEGRLWNFMGRNPVSCGFERNDRAENFDTFLLHWQNSLCYGFSVESASVLVNGGKSKGGSC